MTVDQRPIMYRRLVDGLYVDAMLLADEARGYFEQDGKLERELLDPQARVSFSCEALKVTTRLMQVIAWLLTQRAVEAGELSAREALDASRRLGDAPRIDGEAMDRLPPRARTLVEASVGLYRRAAAQDAALLTQAAAKSPARSLLEHLRAGL